MLVIAHSLLTGRLSSQNGRIMIFFPVPCLFAAKPQKGIVRVNGRERGWKFDIVAKCPGAPIHPSIHPSIRAPTDIVLIDVVIMEIRISASAKLFDITSGYYICTWRACTAHRSASKTIELEV